MAKLGYSQINAQQWAISQSANQCAGASKSARSFYRAEDFLVKAGLITKRQFKIGNDCHGLIIDIQLDSFKFFLSKRHAERCDISAPLPQWQGDKPMTTEPKFSTTDCFKTGLINDQNQEQRQDQDKDKSAVPTKINKTKWKYHPVVFTLLKITTGRPDQGRILFQASAEITQATRNPDAANESGIDWAYWIKRWNELSYDVRENLAALEILPYLIRSKAKKLNFQQKNYVEPNSIRRILEAELSPVFSVPKQAENNQISDTKPDFHAPSEQLFDNNIDDLTRQQLIEMQKKLFWQRKNLNIFV